MKTFLETSNKTFLFSSCEGCPAKCCDGKEGTIFSQLLLEDFEVVSQNFPILFTFGEMGYLKANVLFSNGVDFCPYNIEHKCTIYEERPSICKTYPLSPNLDNIIYIDDSCMAVNSTDTVNASILIENGNLVDKKSYPTLDNYQEEFINTHLYLEPFNDKNMFENVITIKSMKFYAYIGTSNDVYLNMHKKSLVKLTSYYFNL